MKLKKTRSIFKVLRSLIIFETACVWYYTVYEPENEMTGHKIEKNLNQYHITRKLGNLRDFSCAPLKAPEATIGHIQRKLEFVLGPRYLAQGKHFF